MKSYGKENYFNHYHHLIKLNEIHKQYIINWIVKNKRKIITRKTLFLTDIELKTILKNVKFLTKNTLINKDVINKFVNSNITNILIENGVIADKYVTYWFPKYEMFIKENFVNIWISDFKIDSVMHTKIKNLCHISNDLINTILTKNEIFKCILNCLNKEDIIYRILLFIQKNHALANPSTLCRLKQDFKINIKSLDDAIDWIANRSVIINSFDRGFQCELCHKLFDSKKELNFHLRIPHLYKCNKCSLKFIYYFDQVRHFWVKHSGVKMFLFFFLFYFLKKYFNIK